MFEDRLLAISLMECGAVLLLVYNRRLGDASILVASRIGKLRVTSGDEGHPFVQSRPTKPIAAECPPLFGAGLCFALGDRTGAVGNRLSRTSVILWPSGRRLSTASLEVVRRLFGD